MAYLACWQPDQPTTGTENVGQGWRFVVTLAGRATTIIPMHVAYQKSRKPNHWASEEVVSFANMLPGIYFIGRAAAKHAEFYANWCNANPREASETSVHEVLAIFRGNEPDATEAAL